VFAAQLVGAAQAEESYLCIGDNAVGFAQEKDGDWTRRGFRPTKHIVSKPSDDDMQFRKYPFVVKEFGSTAVIAWCEHGFSKSGFLSCIGSFQFIMNKKRLKFAVYSAGAYVYPPRANSKKAGNVFVEIGKCSPL